jgi:hypothetical protein
MLFFLLKDHVDRAPGYLAGHERHVYRLALFTHCTTALIACRIVSRALH